MASRRKSAPSRSATANEISGTDERDDPYAASFDPSSFKVVQLRALLHKHNIVLPSSARKADMIRAYEDEIRPRADEFRAAENRDRNIRPSGEGLALLNADGSVVFLNGDRDGVGSSETESESRMVSGQLAVQGRVAHAAPLSSLLRSQAQAHHDKAGGPFPGQRTLVDQRTTSKTPMRRPFPSTTPFRALRIVLQPSWEVQSRLERCVLGIGACAALLKRSTLQSLTAPQKLSPESKNGVSQLRNYMDPTIASSTPPRIVGSRKFKQEEGEESGMEADLSRDAYDDPPSSPSLQKKKRNSRRRSRLSGEDGDGDASGSGPTARGAAWLVIAALTVYWWLWYTGESRVVGFCDVGRPSNSLLDERVRVQQMVQQAIDEGDDKANLTLQMPARFRPTCQPCPAHARCIEGGLVGCESSDYALQHPLLSNLPAASKLVPLSMTAPSCLPDQQKVLLAADLADEIENRLRAWKGNVQCKRKPARLVGTGDEVFALPSRELFQQLWEEVQRGGSLPEHTSEDYFTELWSLATTDLLANDRIGQAHRGQSSLYAKRGGAAMGLGCRVGLIVESGWQRIRLWLGAMVGLLVFAQWVRHRVQSRQTRQGQVRQLVQATLSRLEKAKRASMQGKQLHDDGVLSISQLRDDILRDDSSAHASNTTKQRLWTAVASVVEANTNVRTRQAKVRGEWARVWEWIGSVEASRVVEDKETKREPNIVNAGKGRLRSAEV